MLPHRSKSSLLTTPQRVRVRQLRKAFSSRSEIEKIVGFLSKLAHAGERSVGVLETDISDIASIQISYLLLVLNDRYAEFAPMSNARQDCVFYMDGLKSVAGKSAGGKEKPCAERVFCGGAFVDEALSDFELLLAQTLKKHVPIITDPTISHELKTLFPNIAIQFDPATRLMKLRGYGQYEISLGKKDGQIFILVSNVLEHHNLEQNVVEVKARLEQATRAKKKFLHDPKTIRFAAECRTFIDRAINEANKRVKESSALRVPLVLRERVKDDAWSIILSLNTKQVLPTGKAKKSSAKKNTS